jgi:2'-5' RNA ligase
MMGDYREMRAFIAIPFRPKLCSRVEVLQKALKRADADVRWVKPENLHVTLQFLGDIPEGVHPDLSHRLRSAISHFEPFQISFEGVGKFPQRGDPRVIWVGCQGDLSCLQGAAERVQQCSAFLNISEKRKVFSPHLTIGRVKSARNQNALLGIMKKKAGEVIGSVRVDRIFLYQSILTPDGPLYEVQQEFPFRTNRSS